MLVYYTTAHSEEWGKKTLQLNATRLITQLDSKIMMLYLRPHFDSLAEEYVCDWQ